MINAGMFIPVYIHILAYSCVSLEKGNIRGHFLHVFSHFGMKPDPYIPYLHIEETYLHIKPCFWHAP